MGSGYSRTSHHTWVISKISHQTNEPSRHTAPLRAIVISLSLGLFISAVIGCTGIQDRYIERHVVNNLTVVFLDDHSLHEQWKQTAGSDPIRFQPQMNNPIPQIQTVKGFYDFTTHTLYCQKWNFEVCGHELHHAVLGHFHTAE